MGQFADRYAWGIWTTGECAARMDEAETYFDVLPYVGLRIYHAHVGLICSTIDQDPIVHL